jgi:uncharacterized protein (TIGR03032 family)
MPPEPSLPGQPLASGNPGPAVDSRDIRFAYSENLPSVLGRLNGALLVSTYQTGNLVVLGARDGRLAVTFHTFERPMGLAVRPGWLAVSARTQVWFLADAPHLASGLGPPGRYDACYLTRSSHLLGNIQGHEMAWVAAPPGAGGGAELWVVNTLFSCLCTPHPTYSFAPRWRPPFVSALAPEDRCHLNGLAVVGGKVKYVTALAETDTAQGWRLVKAGGGCVIDVDSGRTVVRGLTMPHSPRVAGGRLLLLHSGVGQLVTADPADGRVETIAAVDGYTRGLAVDGSLAFVGLSRVRASSSLAGVPIAARPERLRCGVAVVDLRTGQVVANFDFVSGIDELFDVQVLPGSAAPFLAGPLADRDAGPPVWTVPPLVG